MVVSAGKGNPREGPSIPASGSKWEGEGLDQLPEGPKAGGGVFTLPPADNGMEGVGK